MVVGLSAPNDLIMDRYRGENGFHTVDIEDDGTFTLWRFNEDVPFVRTWDIYEGTWERVDEAIVLSAKTMTNQFIGDTDPSTAVFVVRQSPSSFELEFSSGGSVALRSVPSQER